MAVGLPLMKSVLTYISVLLPFGLSAVMSVTDAAIPKKKMIIIIIHGSGSTALIISNEERKDIMKIVKSLGESGLLIKGISKTIKNEAREQEGGFRWISNDIRYISC